MTGQDTNNVEYVLSHLWIAITDYSQVYYVHFGISTNQKSPKFQSVPITKKIMTHLHLMRTKKHKVLSIVVLNMAKYTIISLILSEFVPIFFIFNLFQNILGGHSVSK